MEAMTTTKKRKINLLLPHDVVDRLYEQAGRERRNKSTVLEQATREYLDRMHATAQAKAS
jgi:predicted transcriptional regulator